MLEPASQTALRDEIARQIGEDRAVLDRLRAEVRPLVSRTRPIRPRSATSISLVAADSGNNEYCLEAVSPTMSVSGLSAYQFSGAGGPTALGRLMRYLGVEDLSELSHMIRPGGRDRPNSPRWVQVYRELVEWATLFAIVREKDFATDTLIVFDGFLRSQIFAKDLFRKYREGIQEGIDRQFESYRRRLYLVGVAKRSKVLDRYRLAMALERVMQSSFPCYVEIPRELEEKAYIWPDYARGAR